MRVIVEILSTQLTIVSFHFHFNPTVALLAGLA